MSGQFYLVLFYSLLFTAGAVLIYFGYRYFIARYGARPPAYKYVTLYNLERGTAHGEIVFYFQVPEQVTLKLEIRDLNDKVLKVIEERQFEAGDHRVKFDSSVFGNGEYFYRIVTPHQQTEKKFKIEN